MIEDSISGFLVPRCKDRPEQVERMADRLLKLHELIVSGKIDPIMVAHKASPYAAEPLLGKVYQFHRDIQNAQLHLDGAKH